MFQDNNIESNFLLPNGLLILGCIFLFIAIFYKYNENTVIDKNNTKYQDFYFTHNATQDKQTSYLYLDGFIDIKIKDTTENNYYIAYANNLMYIVLMNEKDYKKLQNINFKKNKTKIIGITNKFDNSTKNKLINVYNNEFETFEDSYLSISEFENYFGKNYLDMSQYKENRIIKDSTIIQKAKMSFTLFFTISVLLIGSAFWKIKKINT